MNKKNNATFPKPHQKGVYCAVGNCVYNDQKMYCTAQKIDIGPSFAITSGDTICGTFQPDQAQK